jgi:restriction system protein
LVRISAHSLPHPDESSPIRELQAMKLTTIAEVKEAKYNPFRYHVATKGAVLKKYFRLILGEANKYSQACLDGSFVGVDFGFLEDLDPYIIGSWQEHKSGLKAQVLKYNPGKTPVGLGLSAGTLSRFGQSVEVGDILLCPDKAGLIHAAEVTSDYIYAPGEILPHRRMVKWLPVTFQRSEMSDNLRAAFGGINTLTDITRYAEEIEQLLGNREAQVLFSADPEILDPSAFALEKHLEDFLIFNWASTDLGKKYDLVTDEGVVVAQQYQSDTGPIDILAISKDKAEYLVIELKKGKASDVVVGQILRYMGFVNQDLAVKGESVRGIVIALEDDLRLKNALSMVPNVSFYRYQIEFKLHEVKEAKKGTES